MPTMHYVQYPDGSVIKTAHPEYHERADRLTRAEGARLYKAEARRDLLNVLSDGATVWCVLRSVSRSGMARTMDFFVIEYNTPIRITHDIATVLGYRLARQGSGLVAEGCGMDMGFAVVNSLSHALGIELNRQWL